MEAERVALGVGGSDDASLSEVVGDFEELKIDLEFANTAYIQTMAAVTAARAEARRQSRYLAPHVAPTLAEQSLYPRRGLISGPASAVPDARLGHSDAHLLQRARQPLRRGTGRLRR